MKSTTPETGTERISAYLDFYKAPMAQLAYEKHPDVSVTFELKNRRTGEPLSEFVEPTALQERLDSFRTGWKPDEVAFLAEQTRKENQTPLFSQQFLNYLEEAGLPEVTVGINEVTGELTVRTSGPWPLVTFWETVVMAEVNEMFFETYALRNDIDLAELYEEGDKRLSKKIEALQSHPEIRFADFGTRRRFSYRWHKHVIERLAAECPGNLIGTSNIWLAHEIGLMPIGTFAHEMPMVYAALSDQAGDNPLEGHRNMLDDWSALYQGNLSTALTDTYTSEYFFADLRPDQAHQWQALRHDSGDPFEFGETAIDFYDRHEIDPLTKTLVYSDGLDIDTILELSDHFGGRINLVFGWGTTLTNDLGLPALNIVMKAVEANGQTTVKLSDNITKAMGLPEVIDRYKSAVHSVVGARALEGATV